MLIALFVFSYNLSDVIKHILNVLCCVYFASSVVKVIPHIGYRIVFPYTELWDEDEEEDGTSLTTNGERETERC